MKTTKEMIKMKHVKSGDPKYCPNCGDTDHLEDMSSSHNIGPRSYKCNNCDKYFLYELIE